MNECAEKRHAPRVNTYIPLRYRKLGDSESVLRGATVTKNLAQGGVRFKVTEFISRACRLIVELDMPMLANPVRAISKVAWIRKTSSGDDFEIGSQFLEMSKNDKRLVLEYINSIVKYDEPEAKSVSDVQTESIKTDENSQIS
ncbi:MAG: PilZ domain-containing protein [Candidatus Omnitrophota bacterium]